MSEIRVLKRRILDEWAGTEPPKDMQVPNLPPATWHELATKAIKILKDFLDMREVDVAIYAQLHSNNRVSDLARLMMVMENRHYDFRNEFGRIAWPLMQRAHQGSIPADSLYQFLHGWPQALLMKEAEVSRKFTEVMLDLHDLREKLGPQSVAPASAPAPTPAPNPSTTTPTPAAPLRPRKKRKPEEWVGLAIPILRRQPDITLSALAAELGVSASTLTRLNEKDNDFSRIWKAHQTQRAIDRVAARPGSSRSTRIRGQRLAEDADD